jgi:hypothetical protein
MNVVNEVHKIAENAFEKLCLLTVLHTWTLIQDIHILEVGGNTFLCIILIGFTGYNE